MDKLTEEEKIKLKTLCEFAFCGLQSYTTTYERFEKCFQPLFNDNIKINLYEAYISMVGEKKKYLTYPRFVNAYLKYKEIKEKKLEDKNDLYIFFSNIFEKILKGIDGFVGKHEDFKKIEEKADIIKNPGFAEHSQENKSKNSVICLSTKRDTLNKENKFNESFISTFQVLVNTDDEIKGIIIEYDNLNKYKLYPEENNEKLLIRLKIILKILDEKLLKEDIKQKNCNKEKINISLHQDSITHIFGTIDKGTQAINFLGFKCFSGKMRYIGKPKGESFLFGEFGKKFYNLRLEINKKKGITLFEPGFINNESIKFKPDIENIFEKDINENILEESILNELDGDELNCAITTNFDEDEYISDEEKDEIKGDDYKEVINLSNRSWIINEDIKRSKNEEEISITPLKIMKSLSDGMPKNNIKNKLDKEQEGFYLYNPNPFLNLPDGKKFENPFFHKKKKEVKNNNVIFIFHRAITLHQIKEKGLNNQENEINSKIIRKSKIKGINFENLMNELSNEIHNQIMNELFPKENNNENNFSLIPFHILNEVIPIELDEREKKLINEKIERERKIMQNEKRIQDNKLSINNINEKDISEEENKIISEESDAAHFWTEINNKLYNKWKEISSVEAKEKKIQNNWKYFSSRLKMRDAKFLFCTIGKIIKIMIKLFNNPNTKEKIPLYDKIKYYQFLSDKANEKIIKFLTKNVDNEDEKKDKKDNNDNLDVSSLKSLTDIDKAIEDLTKKNKDSSQENELKKLKYYRNIFIENLKNLLLNEDERFGRIKNSFLRNFGAVERDRKAPMKKNKESVIYPNKESVIYSRRFDGEKEEIKNYLNQKEIETDKDLKFIPEKNSLCLINKNTNDWLRPLPYKVLNEDIENWDKINWRKIEGIGIFSEYSNPTLDNIRQGEYIGDCYFLSALGALCDRKEYLKNLIHRIKKNGKSIGYKVELKLNGKRKYVLVDKYFPYIELKDDKNFKQKMFCFGSSFQDELWVSLFEKAWAKVNGCYARIGCGGKCGDGFDVLTSAISEYHEILGINDNKKNELWSILWKAKKKDNYVIGAGTRRLGFLERIRGDIGLISSHAYTIINLYSYKDKNKNELIRLVKLRNPWGEKEFNGDWSDNSSKWNGFFKIEFEFKEAKDDGIFYMSYEDFTYYFKSVEILKMKENYEIISSCKISKKEAYKMQIIEFKIKKNENKRENKIKVFINLYQKNPRIRRKNGTYFPDPVRGFLILAKKISENEYSFISSKTDTKAHIAIEEELEIDKDYIIFCDVNYRFLYEEIYGYNITFYCDKSYKRKLEWSRKNINGKDSSEILNKVLYNYYERHPNNFFERNVRAFNVYRLKHYNEDFPFIILIIKNKKKYSGNNYFKLDLIFDKINNKNACIYNDSEASEFDFSVCKQIKNEYSIVLLMGYKLDDKFNFTYQNEDKESINSIFIKKQEQKKGIIYYKTITENKKGIIIEYTNLYQNKLNFDFIFNGAYIINPEYNNDNNNEQNIIQDITLKKGEKKEFYLRIKSGNAEPTYELIKK